jgi:hypothetical protein
VELEHTVVRDEFRSRLFRRAAEMREEGVIVSVDPRFRFRAAEEDLDEQRIDFVIRRFSGLDYLDDLKFDRGIERGLMAGYLSEKAKFNHRKPLQRAPVSVRLIDLQIGFGAFAERDIVPGESLGEYAGIVSRSDGISDRMYCYEYPVLKVGDEEVMLTLDARRAGNETRFINHARVDTISHNFEFFNGHWHTVLTVNEPIAQGEQILMDYGEIYWEGQSKLPEPLSP